jgi:hypothetical protein
MNLKQARENEIYLSGELKKWFGNPTLLTYLHGTNFAQIVEIVRSKDVIFKF